MRLGVSTFLPSTVCLPFHNDNDDATFNQRRFAQMFCCARLAVPSDIAGELEHLLATRPFFVAGQTSLKLWRHRSKDRRQEDERSYLASRVEDKAEVSLHSSDLAQTEKIIVPRSFHILNHIPNHADVCRETSKSLVHCGTAAQELEVIDAPRLRAPKMAFELRARNTSTATASADHRLDRIFQISLILLAYFIHSLFLDDLVLKSCHWDLQLCMNRPWILTREAARRQGQTYEVQIAGKEGDRGSERGAHPDVVLGARASLDPLMKAEQLAHRGFDERELNMQRIVAGPSLCLPARIHRASKTLNNFVDAGVVNQVQHINQNGTQPRSGGELTGLRNPVKLVPNLLPPGNCRAVAGAGAEVVGEGRVKIVVIATKRVDHVTAAVNLTRDGINEQLHVAQLGLQYLRIADRPQERPR
ncbi:hypothetical protein C8R44DRAFT_733180 [Mycena epipterygia]|nr:hypothetical protein C8R44DRAFT_733180 [Mycena epipterygia]